MSGRPVVVLDLDGVIIKLNLLKYKAMFADYPDKLAAIAADILGKRRRCCLSIWRDSRT